MDPNFRTRMEGCGGAAVGVRYAQADAGEEAIGEGICTGCCMDGLRRELLCAKGGVLGNRFDSGVDGGMNTHYAKGKRLHEVWDGENRYRELYQSNWNRLAAEKQTELINSPKAAKVEYDTRMDQLRAILPTLTQEKATEFENAIRQAYENSSRSAQETYDEWHRSNPQYASMTRAAQLKLYFAAFSRKQMKLGDAADLSDVVVKGAGKLATYSGTPNVGDGTGLYALIEAPGSDKHFRKRRGLVISVKIWFKQDGHSIAIYWGPGDVFYLFDPNLGVYSFKSWRECTDAFCYMFREGYAPRQGVVKGRDTGDYVSKDASKQAKGEYFVLAWNG